MLDEQQLGVLVMGARDGGSVFRWEGLRHYSTDSDGGDFDRYVQGLPGPTMTRKAGWLDVLRGESVRGVNWQRVRLIRSPISDYERYACEWGYAYNAAAGDECRILDTAETEIRSPLPERDFWLIDGERVAVMHYDSDGRFSGAELITEPGPFLHAYDVLWGLAEPFYSWWDRHPEHHRQLRAA